MLVHDVDGPISWHLKEKLHICEQEGRSMLPPLGNERNAAAVCKTYLSLEKYGMQLKKKLQKKSKN